jgi:site-specific recombinase XerD
MKRAELPVLSAPGHHALDHYAHALRNTTQVRPTTIRTYLRDLRHVVAWCEALAAEGAESAPPFASQLNATARAALRAYLPTLAPEQPCVFPSRKTGSALTERALSYLVTHATRHAKLTDVRHRFGYRMAAAVPIHRLAHLLGYAWLATMLVYLRGTRSALQRDVATIAWL